MNTEQAKEILKKVRQIEIRTNRLVNDFFASRYQSVFKSRDDARTTRENAAGNKAHALPRNGSTRAGRVFVKKFPEEQELTLLLLVDVSASGDFSSSNDRKRRLATELASLLAFSATRNNDKVGLVLFSDQIEHYIPPRKSRQHVLRVLRETLFFEPRHRHVNIAGALDFASQVTRRGAVLFLVSDFHVTGVQEEALFRLRHAMRMANRRHDLVAMNIHDRNEMELPRVGTLVVEDSETGDWTELDTGNPRVRRRFAEIARTRLDQLRRAFVSEGVDSLDLDTREPYLPALKAFFKIRERRMQ